LPELPDITIYVESLRSRVIDKRLEGIDIRSPFVLRTFEPPIPEFIGRKVAAVNRIGKQIVLELEPDYALIIHLMIAGRLHWKSGRTGPRGKLALAAFHFPDGTLLFTEAGTKKRASLHAVRGANTREQFDRGGLEVLDSSFEDFRASLTAENHTLKRSLTDPRLFSGIGNAYSDEILHRARLSPLRQTKTLNEKDMRNLHRSTKETMEEWIDRIRSQAGSGFPDRVTAFRPEMAVHGKFGKACPRCGTAVQRISYAENECNYCPRCQTGGKILADRSLSRLLKEDWPRTIEELEVTEGFKKSKDLSLQKSD